MTDELRAAIRAVPADREPRRVYADWLLERHDPRGEWIALHASDSDDAELKRRALWQVHGAAWRAADTGVAKLESSEHATYRGGMLEDVGLGYARAIALGPTLAAQPIRRLAVHAIDELGALAASPVLATVEALALGYGLEKADADAILAVLEATPRLTKLALSPQEDVPAVWDALARWGRASELEALDISSIRISAERAKWLAQAVPKLRALTWSAGLTDAVLQVIANHATFELTTLSLHDTDGQHGRPRQLTDSGTAAVLRSPFARHLENLSLFGCQGGTAISDALAELPCADQLVSLGIGSMFSSRCVRGLGDATFPKLAWLSIRQNGVGDGELAVLARFPTLTTLNADMNVFGREGVATILASLPNLVRLDINDTPIGDHGVLAIADAATQLRHLDIGSTGCSSDAIEGIVDGGKLGELRVLGLACNEDISKTALKALADGPFDKMTSLRLSYISNREIAPMFADAWLPAEDGRADSYQRKLAADGTAVPHKTKPKKKKVVDEANARALVATETYTKGEAIKHGEYGVGAVAAVTPLYVSVKFPRHGAFRFGLTPPDSIPYDITQKFAPEQLVLHPKLGAGIVRAATADRVEIEFGIGGKKLLVHNKR